MKEEVCSECKNTNGEHLPRCSRRTPAAWDVTISLPNGARSGDHVSVVLEGSSVKFARLNGPFGKMEPLPVNQDVPAAQDVTLRPFNMMDWATFEACPFSDGSSPQLAETDEVLVVASRLGLHIFNMPGYQHVKNVIMEGESKETILTAARAHFQWEIGMKEEG